MSHPSFVPANATRVAPPLEAARSYPAKPSDVYLFGTCVIDVFFPGAGMDAIRLLEREGIKVHFPQGQSCCGQPAYTSGYTDEAREVARVMAGLAQGIACGQSDFAMPACLVLGGETTVTIRGSGAASARRK